MIGYRSSVLSRSLSSQVMDKLSDTVDAICRQPGPYKIIEVISLEVLQVFFMTNIKKKFKMANSI